MAQPLSRQTNTHGTRQTPARLSPEWKPLELVDPSPYQLASRGLGKRDVEDLIEAIRANGQIQPILVSPAAEDGHFVIQRSPACDT